MQFFFGHDLLSYYVDYIILPTKELHRSLQVFTAVRFQRNYFVTVLGSCLKGARFSARLRNILCHWLRNSSAQLCHD